MKPKEGGRYRILLIDPDAGQYRQGLAASLKDCEILVEPDHYRASEYFFHNDIDIVLLDHSTDHLCTELLQCFKSVKPSVAVIIITARGSEELAVKVFRCGAWDYFRKPPDLEGLSASISTVLGLKQGKAKKDYQHMKGLYRGIGYINRYFNTKITLQQVAWEAGMSISTFTRKFKKTMGVTFTSYVNNLRISRAVEMLKEDDFSMSDIAFACGFTNQFHFTRTFKKIKKTTPTRFRKALGMKHETADTS